MFHDGLDVLPENWAIGDWSPKLGNGWDSSLVRIEVPYFRFVRSVLDTKPILPAAVG